MATEEVTFGPYRLRLQQTKKSLWEGIIVGRARERFAAPSRAALIDRLQKAAMATEKGFSGMDVMRQRFLGTFPGGFEDPAYLAGERGVALALAEKVSSELPLDSLDAAGAPAAALRLLGESDLVDPATKTRLAAVLEGPDARRYLDIAAGFATGSVTRACARSNAELDAAGVNSWEALTFFPFFWRKGAHMFLSPDFATRFARRIGDPFQYACDARPNPATYLALLEMCEQLKEAIADMGARDRIDLHAFMRVVNS